MSVTMGLLNLLGGVAILIWGLRMVRTAATRGLGGKLRVLLLRATRSQPKAFLFGSGASLILQSSTAAILLIASFVGKGFVSLPAALAAALGADLGTALATQVLRLDIAFAAPAAALLGYVLFRLSGTRRLKNVGRALLGLGFILLALKLIIAASAPMRSSEILIDALGALMTEPVLAALLAAALTWLSHSSLAVVLLIAALASGGIIGGTLGLALIAGVNLGAALPAVLATSASLPCERRVAVGNLVFRVEPTGNRLLVTLVNDVTLEPESLTTDQMIVEHGTVPVDELYHELRGQSANDGVTDIEALLAGQAQPRSFNPDASFELHRIGDAVASRNIHAAILDALRLCAVM